jgi:ectoine hydroxylase-related dioxygenase (phytanoyl-CoA dioxygenase family)
MENRKLRARFKDEKLDEQFDKEGYILIRNWANATQVAKMKELFNTCYQAPEYSTNIFNTLSIASEELKTKISNGILEQLLPLFENDFYDYESIVRFFLTRPTGGEQQEVALHSDSSTINEAKFEYMTLWLPLVDTEKSNGCMYIIPGSQKLFTYEIPFNTKWPYPQLDKILKKYKLDLPMKAGDVLLFSNKTIHGSYHNFSEDPRPVVGSILTHPASEMWFNYLNTEKNVVTTYKVDAQFYLGRDFGEPNSGKFPFIRSYEFNPPEVTPEMIKQFFKENPVKHKGRFALLRRLGWNCCS